MGFDSLAFLKEQDKLHKLDEFGVELAAICDCLISYSEDCR